jgi:hypothetical protein
MNFTWRRIKILLRISTKMVFIIGLIFDLKFSFCFICCSPSKPESIVFDVSSSSIVFKKLKSTRIFSISKLFSVCSWIWILIILSKSFIICSILSNIIENDRSIRRKSSRHVRTWSISKSSS